MIAVAAPINTPEKSSFITLGRYITSTQNNDERIENIQLTNFQANDLETAMVEAIATQGVNTRSHTEKNYHLIISFPSGEFPSKEVLQDIENTFCKDLGFEEHQRISAVHGDTDCAHLHIAINKVNPITHKVVTPYRDFQTLADTCVALEEKHHLVKVNHKSKLTVSQSKANDMEKNSGRESFLSWTREQVLEEIKNGKSWEEIHDITKKNNVTLKSRGNGLVFATLNEKNKPIYLKASSVDRALSKKNLEEKLGLFIEDPEAQIRKGGYEGKPKGFSVDTSSLFKEWQTINVKNLAAKKIEMESNKDYFKIKLESIKKSGMTRRKLIQLTNFPPAVKRLLYARENKRMQEEIKQQRYLRDIKKNEIHQKYKRQQWADWLKKEAGNDNPQAILALRSREYKRVEEKYLIEGVKKTELVTEITENEVKKLTKHGSIFKKFEGVSIKDRGSEITLKIKQGEEVGLADYRALILAAKNKYGNVLQINGNADFKAKILLASVIFNVDVKFNEPLLESRRQEIQEKILNTSKQEDKENERTGPTRITTSGKGLGRGIRNATRTRTNAELKRERGRSDSGLGRVGAITAKGAIYHKSYLKQFGSEPPATRRNRLHVLSELNMVQQARETSVLLQSNVSNNMGERQARDNQRLRWGVFGAGIEKERIEYADQYIEERNNKRRSGIDVAKHIPYNGEKNLIYRGQRNGMLILLENPKNKDEIQVMPVNKETVEQIKKIKLGTEISINKGRIRRAGRGRK